MSSIVAIVGRPNVGKSTLFNRLIGARQAITDATEGTTRDRHYGTTDWNGRTFTVVDTGGFTVNSEDIFEREIVRQVSIAIEESDVIVFMVDVETGIADIDQTLASILRRSSKPVILAVNKVDNSKRHLDSYEFFSLGLGDPISVSSMTGGGTGDMLDAVVLALPSEEEEEKRNNEELDAEMAGLPKFAIVGRPNVGKSSLTNALLGEERNIVTNLAGTTRDSINSRYNKFGYDFMLIDTAGVRKKTKVTEDLEFYSVLRAIRSIELCDVAYLVIDATVGLDAQDMNIFQLIVKNRKGCVVIINKWDKIENKETNSARDYANEVKRKLAPFNDVPILFTSAIEKQRIMDMVKKGAEVYENRQRRISTSQLNEFILPIIENTPPPAIKGKYIKIKYATQLPTQTPQFAFFVNLPQYVKDHYRRFLENKIRDNWDFTGCPIQIYFRQK
ncbi:MAG: ribosome biogenesis GTPase Der [Rikenellaceae bacterium]